MPIIQEPTLPIVTNKSLSAVRHLMAAAVLVGLLTGCGSSSVSETTPIEQVRAEAAKMDANKLLATVDLYKIAIAAKQAELDKTVARIKEIAPDLGTTAKGLVGGLTGSEDAKKAAANLEKIKAEVDKLNAAKDEIMKSIKALQERMEIYSKQKAK